MKKIVIFLVLSLFYFLTAVFTVGCTGSDNTNTDTFTMYLPSEPTNLDPARGVDVHEAKVQSKIFDGLVKYNSKMQLVGSLADNWQISEDGTVYKFNLKKNVIFHDGTPFTAKDAVFSLKRLLSPSVASPRRWVLDKVAENGINAIDDYTLEIKLTEPFAPFMCLLTMPSCYILPAAKLENSDEAKVTAFFEKPCGTGAFMVSQRVRDSHIVLDANEKYHDKKPQIKQLIIRVIPENMKAEMEFESGSIDMLALGTSNYAKYKAQEKYKDKIVDVAALNVYYVGFNNRVGPFNDVRVRQALNMLIDRDSIIKSVYSGRAIAAKGSIPPGIGGYDPNLKGYTYDLENAKKLLNEAGFCCGSDKNGENGLKTLEFDLYHRAQQDTFEICRFIQGELKKAGVVANLKSMEWSALKDAINKGEAPAFFMNWFADYPDAENFLYPVFHSKNLGAGGNRAGFINTEVDKMLDECVKITDTAKREATYAEINAKVVEQAPWIYLWHSSESFLLGNRVKNMEFSPVYFCDNGSDIQLAISNNN